MNMKVQSTLLANALFSLISALLMVLEGAWLSVHIPLPSWLWLALGAGLGLFALQLLAMAINPKLMALLIKQVIVSDIIWVVAAGLAAGLFVSELSTTGIVLVLAVNIMVASLAYLQFSAWKRQAGV